MNAITSTLTFLLCLSVTISMVDSKPILEHFIHTFFSNHPELNRTQQLRQYESTLDGRKIWLTVSSVVNTTVHNQTLVRALEVQWRSPSHPASGDYLALYSVHSDYHDNSQPLRRYPLFNSDDGQLLPPYFRTDIEFPYTNLTSLVSNSTTSTSPDQTGSVVREVTNPANQTDVKECLHYYLVYYDAAQGRVVAFNCIQLNARWMEVDFDLLQNHTLDKLMLPGTHDASSYLKYDDTYESNVITRFHYTQDETIYNQLAYGIRYLDFRVGAYNVTSVSADIETVSTVATESFTTPETSTIYTNIEALFHEELWMVHDYQRNSVNLTDALRQVKRFLQQTTHEIVVVDFHRFVAGFDQVDDMDAVRQRLKFFIEVVTDELGSYLIPFRQQRQMRTVGELVREGKRVLLGYAYKSDDRSLPDSDLFWPAVSHQWAQADSLSKLKRFMEQRLCADKNKNDQRMRSMMAELTPTFDGVILLRYHGLRELAAEVNIHFDNWFRHRYWNCTNIVAADFFLGSNIVQIAIDVNRRRFG